MALPPLSRSITRPVSLALFLFALSFSLTSCVKRARDKSLAKQSEDQTIASSQAVPTRANEQQPGTSLAVDSANQTPRRININTAAAKELETLPGIGKGLADRIVEHRDKYGPFRRPEHLIAVRGISDRRFRALRNLITVE